MYYFIPKLFPCLQIFEDVHLHEKPKLAKTLEILNFVFAAIFTLEFILKVIGFGLIKYFSSAWNCLDTFIVSVSIFEGNTKSKFIGLFKLSISSFYASFPQISIACVFENKNLAVFRSLRTLRALRPLRAISRLEGMRVNKRFRAFFLS